MILEIDAGNTRIKWRCWRQDNIAGYGVLLTENVEELGADIEAIGQPEKIRFSSVADENVRQAVRALANKWDSEWLEAKTTKEAAGVCCGYHDPSLMGVDRWLAVVAAHRRNGACVVVDAGSAITVDVVDAGGHHLGGYIVPGFGLMRESLSCGTSAVEVSVQEAGCIVPGRSTVEAVNHGALLMVKAMVEFVVKEWLEDAAAIVLTGGDARHLQSVLSGQVQLVPELVLDGLALVSP